MDWECCLELQQYIKLLRRWYWLIVISAIISGGIAFIVTAQRPPAYETQVTVAIGQFIQSPNPNASEIRTGIDLAQTYAQIVRTSGVLQATIEALNLPLSIDSLRNRLTTRIITNTSLLVVTVNYGDPVLAADIANEVARQLILQSPTNLTPEQQTQVDFLNRQIEALNLQVTNSRIQLEQIDARLLSATTDAERERLTAERNTALDQINQAQSTIAQFISTVASLQQRTNSIDIVEQARIPTTPVGSSLQTTVILGALVGAMLAFGIVLLIEYLDDTIRSTEEAAQIFALPVLAAIVRFGKANDSYNKMLLTNYPSLSPIAEGYRTARTNLLYSAGTERKPLLIVTSANPQEGKTVTSSNLAVTMAQSGLQVLLIDADLRRPKVHNVFGLENNVGLTTLLFSDPKQFEGRFDANGLPHVFEECVQQSSVPKLRVMTSGFVPSNPTEILGSAIMARWVELLMKSPAFDAIIIDSPPILAAADTMVLASNIKATVALVIDNGKTRRNAALKAKESLNNLNIEMAGVIVNRISPRDEDYAYYAYYYSYSSPGQSR